MVIEIFNGEIGVPAKCKRDKEYYEYLLHGRSKLI
jgi:hypothetical protein